MSKEENYEQWQTKYTKKINIGCGWDKRDGYLNIDLNSFHKPDLVADACNLSMLPAAHFDHIIAQDVLEHLERSKSLPALSEWSRLLSSEGVLTLRIPSLKDMFNLLNKPENRPHEEAEKIIHLIYGTQAYNGDYHLAGFTAEVISHLLGSVGLKVTKAELKDSWLFDIEAKKYESPLTDGEFLQNAYFNILGRPIDKGGYNYFLEQLKQIKITRLDVETILKADS